MSERGIQGPKACNIGLATEVAKLSVDVDFAGALSLLSFDRNTPTWLLGNPAVAPAISITLLDPASGRPRLLEGTSLLLPEPAALIASTSPWGVPFSQPRPVDSEHWFRDAVEHLSWARAWSLQQGLRPLASQISTSWVGAFIAAGLSVVKFCAFEHWLEIPEAVSEVNDLLALLPRRARQTWNRDIRDAESGELSAEVAPATAAGLRKIAPHLAAVACAHGGSPASSDHLAKMFLEMRFREGRHYIVTVSDASGETVAAAFCRHAGEVFESRYIGMLEAHPYRRQAYILAGYLTPLQLAVGNGARKLALGRGAEKPKLARGCHQESIFDLTTSQGSEQWFR